MQQEDILINWSFPELEKPERSRSWYVWATLIALLLLVFAVFSQNFLFGLIIILVAVVLFAYHHKEIEEVEFAILDNGISVGEKFFNFSDLKHFWIIYEPPYVKNLYFEFKNSIRPRLTIPFLDINPVKVRKILLEFLQEDLSRETEPLSESIGKRLKL
ncbi:MAG: hypothetical protein ABIF17_02725 [Patescibacteria group bacterium]